MVKQQRSGQVISALVVLFMVFDGVIHVMRIAPVVEAFAQLGYPLRMAVPLGILELCIAALYAIPGTAVIGAMLLTAYFGGATAAQLRIGADLFPIVFHSGRGSCSSATVLRGKDRPHAEGTIRRRRDLRVRRRLVGLHVSISRRRHLEGEHGVLGR